MVIGVSTLRISLPVFVAEQHGLFAKHGIDAEMRRFDTAQPLADELGAARIDAGGYVAFPILFGPGAPPPRVRILTAVVEDASHPLSYLLVKKGSGLRGVAALRGRRIGILPTAAYRDWLTAILRHDGLRPDDVSIVPLAPPLRRSTRSRAAASMRCSPAIPWPPPRSPVGSPSSAPTRRTCPACSGTPSSSAPSPSPRTSPRVSRRTRGRSLTRSTRPSR